MTKPSAASLQAYLCPSNRREVIAKRLIGPHGVIPPRPGTLVGQHIYLLYLPNRENPSVTAYL
jgi:hypothetical protein